MVLCGGVLCGFVSCRSGECALDCCLVGDRLARNVLWTAPVWRVFYS